jgi:hypothetical protein
VPQRLDVCTPIPLSDGTTLFAFADPSRPAYQSFVLWLPTASRRMVRARCTMVRSDAAANVMMLATFRAKRFATIGVDGVSVVTLKGDRSCVSIIACGWQALTRPVVVTFELDGFDELGVRIECLRTLQRLADPGLSTPAAPAPTTLTRGCGRPCWPSTQASPAKVIARSRRRFSGKVGSARTGTRPVASSKTAFVGWSRKVTL